MRLQSAAEIAGKRVSLAADPLFPLFPSGTGVIVAPNGNGNGKPDLSIVSNRFFSEWGGMAGWADSQISRLYGPYNPLRVDDFTLAVMAEDWSIRLALETIKAAYYSIEWMVEGPSAELNAMVKQVLLKRMSHWVEALLVACEFGRSISELVWGLDDLDLMWKEESGKDEDGNPAFKTREKTMRDAYVLREPRDLDPFQTQILEDGRGDFLGVTTSGGYIPKEKCVHAIQDGRFGNLYGRAIHKSAVRPWRSKMIVYLSFDRYLEQKGNPPLIGTAPDTEIATTSGSKIPAGKAMLAALANLRGGGVHVIPAGYDPASNQPLYSVRVLEVPPRAAEFIPYIQHLEALCFIATFVPPSLLGVHQVPYSGAKPSERAFYASLDKRKKRVIIDPINEQVIPRLIRANAPSAKPSEYPTLRGSDIAENAKEVMSELLRASIALAQKGESGQLIQIASMIDWPEVIETLGLPRAQRYQEVIQPKPIAVDPLTGEPKSGEAPRASSGRPNRISPEAKNADFPSRPGLSLAAAPSSEAWVSKVLDGLDQIDRVVWKAEKLVESERMSVEAEVRNMVRKALARARTSGGALEAKNRTLARDLGRDIEEMLEKSMFEDLLDEGEIALAKSPLATAHMDSAEAASETLESAGVSFPGRVSGTRIIRDVVRDGKTNARGIIKRETRRVTESIDRLIIGEESAEVADEVASAYKMPDRDYMASTVDHVRATARATLTHPGAQAESEAWAVLAGPGSERRILDRFPRGGVAEVLYTVKTADQLDADFRRIMVVEGRPVTSWRNLGMNFGSEEMYVPIPRGSLLPIAAVLEKMRRDWNRKREERQRELDEIRTKE